jgi:hypothetical protein
MDCERMRDGPIRAGLPIPHLRNVGCPLTPSTGASHLSWLDDPTELYIPSSCTYRTERPVCAWKQKNCFVGRCLRFHIYPWRCLCLGLAEHIMYR